jgi:predicted ferric reductase
MNRIRASLLGLIAALTLLWIAAETAGIAAASGVFPWRVLLLQYSGILAIGTMSAAMLLAVRPGWLEGPLDGLDKMYRLHKWLGISGLSFSILHWLIANGPKWLVAAGWLVRPERGRGAASAQSGGVVQFLRDQRGLAEDLGEWAFYLAIALIVLALLKRFPYRLFFRAHRLLAIVYLGLVFHSVVLMRLGYWTQPVGLASGALMAIGTLAAVLSLFRRIGARHKAVGEVESVVFLPQAEVTAVDIRLHSIWPGHDAGQFAFVNFDRREGPHPFTISSAWQHDGRLRFLIKALGDYTRTLKDSLSPGSTVVIEGPYGRFDFEGASRRQVWIGAGIGIAPFVARLKSLAANGDGRTIDLFHSTRVADREALKRLEEDAKAAGVRLHLILSNRDGRLTGERLRASVPDWREADFWFCGPAAFGKALRLDLTAQGLPATRFHQELFELR